MGDLMRCGLGKLQQEILANLDEARGWLIRKLNDYGNVKKSHQRRSRLAGRTPAFARAYFLTIPLAADVDHSSGISRLWEVKYSTGPL